jgi:hypothetical protein
MPGDSAAQKQSNEKLAAALALADYGFSIFPLVTNDKRPLIENWRNLATNDKSQVRKWWTANPDANIGISTENLLVIDIDPRNGGDDTFKFLMTSGQLTGEEFTPTLAAGTWSGGTHIFYWLPEHTSVKSGANRLGPGVDIKSSGGYVVGAGSTIDGKPYGWKAGYGPNDKERDFAEAQPWLIAKCNAAKPKSPDAGKVVVNEDETAFALARKYLSTAPEAVQGGRDNTAFMVAARLYDFGISKETCFELLIEWNETHCHPPLESHELERIAWSAGKNRDSAIGAKHPNAPGFEVHEASGQPPAGAGAADGFDAIDLQPRSSGQGAANDNKKRRFTYWRADEGARQALQQVGDPLIKGVIHRGAMSVLIGAPGGGKTFFVLDWAYHIATGKPWGGRAVKQGAVVYLAAEAGNMLKGRVAALEKHYGALGDTPLFVVPTPADFAHGEADAAEMLRLILEVEERCGQKVELFVIDTLNRALAGGDENSSKDVGALIRNVDQIRDRAKVHALIIHHPGKDEAKGGRGHSSVLGGTDTEMVISKHVLKFTKQRDMACADDIAFRLKPVSIGRDAEGAELTSCVIEIRKKGERDETVALTRTERELFEALQEAAEDADLCGDMLDDMSSDLRFDWRFAQKVSSETVSDKTPTRPTIVGLLSGLSEKGWIEKVGPNQYLLPCRKMSENVGK